MPGKMTIAKAAEKSRKIAAALEERRRAAVVKEAAEHDAIARHCAPVTGSVWRPIREAPKDGTPIVGWWDQFGPKEIFWEHGFVEVETGIVLHHTSHPRLWVPSPNDQILP